MSSDYIEKMRKEPKLTVSGGKRMGRLAIENQKKVVSNIGVKPGVVVKSRIPTESGISPQPKVSLIPKVSLASRVVVKPKVSLASRVVVKPGVVVESRIPKVVSKVPTIQHPTRPVFFRGKRQVVMTAGQNQNMPQKSYANRGKKKQPEEIEDELSGTIDNIHRFIVKSKIINKKEGLDEKKGDHVVVDSERQPKKTEKTEHPRETESPWQRLYRNKSPNMHSNREEQPEEIEDELSGTIDNIHRFIVKSKITGKQRQFRIVSSREKSRINKLDSNVKSLDDF